MLPQLPRPNQVETHLHETSNLGVQGRAAGRTQHRGEGVQVAEEQVAEGHAGVAGARGRAQLLAMAVGQGPRVVS